jgi:DNA-binding PucR family transcriptional regulator
LTGEQVDHAALAYELEGNHVGVIAFGSAEVQTSLRQIAEALDMRLLIAPQDEKTTWAWFGAYRKIDAGQLKEAIQRQAPRRTYLALGEARQNLSGWRLSHRQAQAAFLVARKTSSPIVRYSEAALLASMLQDDLLANSLHELYLALIVDERDGGATFCDTLQAYIKTECSVSSTAAALKVSRQTVTNRFRRIEEKLDRPLRTCLCELEAALRVHAPPSSLSV